MDDEIKKKLSLTVGWRAEGAITGIDRLRFALNSLAGVGARIQRLFTSTLGMLGFGASIYGVISLVRQSVNMFAEEEAIMFRLKEAVEQSGESWDAVGSKVNKYLLNIQATTKFSDEEAAIALQRIVQLTGSLEKGFEGTTIALAIAKQGFMDIGMASRVVAIAMQGQIGRLAMLLPDLKSTWKEVRANSTAEERWAVVKKELIEKFGKEIAGTNTFKAALQSLRNWVDEVKERLGGIIAVKLTPKLNEWRDAVIKFLDSEKFKKFSDDFDRFVNSTLKKTEERLTWIWEHRDTLLLVFKGVMALGVVGWLANVSLQLFTVGKGIAYVATMSGLTGVGVGGAAVGLGVLGLIGAGWYYIGDAAGGASKKIEEAARVNAKALAELKETFKGTGGENWVQWQEMMGVRQAMAVKYGAGGYAMLPGATVTGVKGVKGKAVDEEQVQRAKEATEKAIADLGFSWSGYYDWRKKKVEEEARQIGDSAIRELWLAKEMGKLNEGKVADERAALERYNELLDEWNKLYGDWEQKQTALVVDAENNRMNWMYRNHQISSEEYVSYLKGKLEHTRKFSDEWISIDSQISQIESDRDIERKQAEEDRRNFYYQSMVDWESKTSSILAKGMTGEMRMRDVMKRIVVLTTVSMVSAVLKERAREWLVLAQAYALSGQWWNAAKYTAGAAVLEAGATAMEAYAESKLEQAKKEGAEVSKELAGAGTTGAGGVASYGTQVTAEKMEVTIAPVISIEGDTILVGTMGIEELKATLGRAAVESVQEAMETGEINVREIS